MKTLIAWPVSLETNQKVTRSVDFLLHIRNIIFQFYVIKNLCRTLIMQDH